MAVELYDQFVDGEMDGFSKHRQNHLAKVNSAVRLISDLRTGRAPSYFLQEAIAPRTPGVCYTIERNYPGLFQMRETMTRSDFPLLTGDILDRMALARYREFPSPWRMFAKVVPSLRDFRTVRRIAADGLEGQWDQIPETTEVGYGALSETGYTYSPQIYGKAAKISFQALMNDDLDQFTSIPDRLGRGGARTINKFATQLYVDASGPHASLYTSGNKNQVITANGASSNNPVLSVAGLQSAWNVLRNMKDADNEPIMVEAATLVVPTALEVTARNILNAIQVWSTTVGGATNQELHYDNWIGSALKLAVDPYISVVASSANGNTSWFLFADPSVGRQAIEIGFLSGFSEPQLYQKVANTVRVGGGGVDQMAGDFMTMSQEYKGLLAFGGARMDPKATVASNGSGS